MHQVDCRAASPPHTNRPNPDKQAQVSDLTSAGNFQARHAGGLFYSPFLLSWPPSWATNSLTPASAGIFNDTVDFWIEHGREAAILLAVVVVLGLLAAVWRVFFPVRWHMYMLALGGPKGHGAAVESLAKIGPSAVPILMKKLQDRGSARSDIRREALAEALGKIGEPAIPALIRAFGEAKEDEYVHKAAVEALVIIGEPAIPAMIAGLDEPNRCFRRAATDVLDRLGALTKELSVRGYMRDLADSDWRVRREAVFCRSTIGLEVAYLGAFLAKALRDEHAGVREAAAVGLGKVGPQAAAAVPSLAALLTSDKDQRVRRAAAKALGKVGPQAAGAIPTLAALMRSDRDQHLRKTAARALGRMGEPGVAVLAEVLGSADKGVRRYAAWALGKVGPNAAAAAPSLVALLTNDKDPHVREAAVKALGSMGEPAVPFLARALESTDNDVRRYAAFALGNIGEPAIKDLIWAVEVDGEYGDAREYAAHALGSIGPKAAEAVPALMGLAVEGSLSAIDALGSIGPKAARAVPALIRLIEKGEELDLVAAVAHALGSIICGSSEFVPETKGAVRALEELYCELINRMGEAAGWSEREQDNLTWTVERVDGAIKRIRENKQKRGKKS